MRVLVPTAIVLDTTPLSLLAQKRGHPQGDICRDWSTQLTDIADCILFIPEIADYEVRRELLRVRNYDGITRLTQLRGKAIFMSLSTSDILLAAGLWAETRQKGRPTSDDKALDADAFITAQARLLIPARYGLYAVVIATGDIKDMTALSDVGPPPAVPAALWADIQP